MQIQSVEILGVRVDNVTDDQAVKQVELWLKEKDPHYIVTTNLEFILAAQKDEDFKRVLNEADLSIPDSSRLGLAYWLSKKNIVLRFLLWPLFFLPPRVVIQFNIVSGVDLMEGLCGEAFKQGFTVGFLGGRDGVAKRAAECLTEKYPGLKVVLAEDGGVVDQDGNRLPNPNPTSFPRCGILFVAYGQVKQEKWISRNLNKLPVKVMMGVGGSFDEISGKVPRVPVWVHQLGFKWLLRLVFQPWRLKRQLALGKLVWKMLLLKV